MTRSSLPRPMDNESAVASPLPFPAPGSAGVLLWGPGQAFLLPLYGGRCLRFMRVVLASIHPPRTPPLRVEVGLSEVEAARSGSSAGGPGLGEGALHLGDNSLAIQLFQKGAIFSYLSIRLFIANRVTGVEGWGGRPALTEALGAQPQPWGAQGSASGPEVDLLLEFPGPSPKAGGGGTTCECVHTRVSASVSVRVWMSIEVHARAHA